MDRSLKVAGRSSLKNLKKKNKTKKNKFLSSQSTKKVIEAID
jgi:hypothetical protein